MPITIISTIDDAVKTIKTLLLDGKTITSSTNPALPPGQCLLEVKDEAQT